MPIHRGAPSVATLLFMLFAGCATAVAQKTPDVKTSIAAQADAARLRDATQLAWDIRRQQLPGHQVKVIESLGQTIRATPGQLFVGWLSFGTVHELLVHYRCPRVASISSMERNRRTPGVNSFFEVRRPNSHTAAMAL